MECVRGIVEDFINWREIADRGISRLIARIEKICTGARDPFGNEWKSFPTGQSQLQKFYNLVKI